MQHQRKGLGTGCIPAVLLVNHHVNKGKPATSSIGICSTGRKWYRVQHYFITTCQSSLSVFMTRKTPSGTRKHQESTKPGTCKSSSFLHSLDGLAQYCVNLSQWFSHETTCAATPLLSLSSKCGIKG